MPDSPPEADFTLPPAAPVDHPPPPEQRNLNRVIPFATLTPQNCAVLAERSESALPILGMGKLARVLRNRFTSALDRLRGIAARGRWGASPDELQLDAQAVATATDFFQIADVMPLKISDRIGRELAQALEGKLQRNRSSRAADEFLSQFWVGLIIARGGISPGVPPIQDKPTPDYVVKFDTLECGVEVKRPESLHSAPDAMDRAAAQLRDYRMPDSPNRRLPGFIALDLTDALFTPDMAVRYIEHPGLLHAVLRPQFGAFSTQLEHRVETYTRSDKYEGIIGLALFARLHFWEVDDLNQPKGSYLFSVTRFEKACSGLLVEQATNLRRIIMAGAADVAGGQIRRL